MGVQVEALAKGALRVRQVARVKLGTPASLEHLGYPPSVLKKTVLLNGVETWNGGGK